MKDLAWAPKIAGVAVLAATLVSGPSFAQTAEEIIVYGHYGPAPENARSASQVVSYADLDLSTDAGRRELKHRVSLTARYLCDRLGETGSGDALAPSCREQAVRDAMSRVGTVEAHFAPRGTAWVAPPAWVAPYPVEWVTLYP